MEAATKRQQIVEALTGVELTPRELAGELEMPLSRLLDELEHVAKSHKSRFTIRPARCVGCGFSFTKRSRLSTPSRCPNCRSERTEGPFLSITQ